MSAYPADFEHWYEQNERLFDGSVKQAAFIGYRHGQNPREVAQSRMEAARCARAESTLEADERAAFNSEEPAPHGWLDTAEEERLAAMAAGGTP